VEPASKRLKEILDPESIAPPEHIVPADFPVLVKIVLFQARHDPA
jgi:hypothetical protein